MSNFSDMAYDSYLMHYRIKGSRNGYSKDPDYTPVGKRAKEEREKAARRNEINMRSGQARRGDYAGMPSSAMAARERARTTKARASEINRLSKQKSSGDYAGMPSSALRAKENAERASEISRLSKQARRGDYAGMPTSAKDAKARAVRAKEISERAKLERFKAEARNKNLMWEAWRRKWKNQRGK